MNWAARYVAACCEQDTRPLPEPPSVEVVDWGASDPNPGPVPWWVDAFIGVCLLAAVLGAFGLGLLIVEIVAWVAVGAPA